MGLPFSHKVPYMGDYFHGFFLNNLMMHFYLGINIGSNCQVSATGGAKCGSYDVSKFKFRDFSWFFQGLRPLMVLMAASSSLAVLFF
jgi:hypothetical protein